MAVAPVRTWRPAMGWRPGAPADWSALLRPVLVVAIVVFFTLVTPSFLSAGNLYALMQSFALLGLVTLGLAMTMIAGEFDLSIGALVAVAGLIAVKLGGDSAFAGIAGAVGFGVLVGLINAAIFVGLKVSSLVVTVGTMMLLQGAAFWTAGGRVVSYGRFEPGEFLDMRLFLFLSPKSLITLAAFALAFLLLRQTRLGRDIYATGSHRRAAVASGARTNLSLVLVFCLSGGLAALAGALLSVSLASASATQGGNLLLQAASAAILGGVALAGGVGSAGGILVGVLILTALNNGLGLIGTGSAAILFANGLVLLLVVLLDGRLGSVIREQMEIRRRR